MTSSPGTLRIIMSLSLFLSSYFHFYSMENSPTNSVNKIDVFSTEEFINDVIWPIGSSVSEKTILMKSVYRFV